MRLWPKVACFFLVVSIASIPVQALEIRGAAAGMVNGQSNLVDNTFTWNTQNFAGFDYDIDHGSDTETLTTKLTEGNRLSGDYPYGVTYTTSTRAFKNAKVGALQGKMRIASIDSATGEIVMDNSDNAITISKNKTVELLPGIYLKTADNDTLRYYIYKVITAPGTYTIRGTVASSNLVDNSFTWDPQTFAGFYYDIKNDLGTENLKFVLAEGNKLSGDAPYGVTYTTIAQSKAFERALWGSYKVIGFLGEEYFAGYNQGNTEQDGSNIFYAESTDKNSLSDEQLEKILLNEKTKQVVKKGESLKLKEGYELAVRAIDENGKMYVELLKDGKVVDNYFLAPSKDFATELDKTYYYRNPEVGNQRNLVTIGVHFRNANKVENFAQATVDGLWQLSEMPIDINPDTQYDKMRVSMVDAMAGVITMDNKDEELNLTRKSDIELMPGIGIRTADNDTLRYYIYKTVTIK